MSNMKTQDLVTRLAADTVRVERDAVRASFSRALLLGLVGSTMLLAMLYETRTDMPQALATAAFWIKLAFPVVVLAATLGLAERLARPGAKTKAAWLLTALALAMVWSGAAALVLVAPPAIELHLAVPDAWPSSSLNIAILSIPPLFATMSAMRGLAPTKLVRAGVSAGMLASAEAVLVYTLYCVDTTMPYWGVPYVLGTLVPSVLGGALGPWLLRW
jgi:hypothetical protein